MESKGGDTMTNAELARDLTAAYIQGKPAFAYSDVVEIYVAILNLLNREYPSGRPGK